MSYSSGRDLCVKSRFNCCFRQKWDESSKPWRKCRFHHCRQNFPLNFGLARLHVRLSWSPNRLINPVIFYSMVLTSFFVYLVYPSSPWTKYLRQRHHQNHLNSFLPSITALNVLVFLPLERRTMKTNTFFRGSVSRISFIISAVEKKNANSFS